MLKTVVLLNIFVETVIHFFRILIERIESSQEFEMDFFFVTLLMPLLSLLINLVHPC